LNDKLWGNLQRETDECKVWKCDRKALEKKHEKAPQKYTVGQARYQTISRHKDKQQWEKQKTRKTTIKKETKKTSNDTKNNKIKYFPS